jgi:hypothetical protein
VRDPSSGAGSAPVPQPAQAFFTGHEPRECGEHRTVGAHRAWCFACTEWCYPSDGCKGCRLGLLCTTEPDEYLPPGPQPEPDEYLHMETPLPPGPRLPEDAGRMCECNHHWGVHRESGQTAPDLPCHGYTGNATPGPLRQPCLCTGFAPWTGPRDSRTGEPVRPLTMTIDARFGPRLPEEAIQAATKAVRNATLAVPCPEGREIAIAVLEAASPLLLAEGARAEREALNELGVNAIATRAAVAGRRLERQRIRQLMDEHHENSDCDLTWLADLLDGEQP